jgi:hypothetical protein
MNFISFTATNVHPRRPTPAIIFLLKPDRFKLRTFSAAAFFTNCLPRGERQTALEIPAVCKKSSKSSLCTLIFLSENPPLSWLHNQFCGEMSNWRRNLHSGRRNGVYSARAVATHLSAPVSALLYVLWANPCSQSAPYTAPVPVLL